jgi:hypothetical protein
MYPVSSFPSRASPPAVQLQPAPISRGISWENGRVGDGSGNNFFITLYENGDAKRSLGDVHGKWVDVDGEARITWDDGAQDAIRKIGSSFQKRAFGANKSFSDSPDNVTAAHNTTPHPI